MKKILTVLFLITSLASLAQNRCVDLRLGIDLPMDVWDAAGTPPVWPVPANNNRPNWVNAPAGGPNPNSMPAIGFPANAHIWANNGVGANTNFVPGANESTTYYQGTFNVPSLQLCEQWMWESYADDYHTVWINGVLIGSTYNISCVAGTNQFPWNTPVMSNITGFPPGEITSLLNVGVNTITIQATDVDGSANNCPFSFQNQFLSGNLYTLCHAGNITGITQNGGCLGVSLNPAYSVPSKYERYQWFRDGKPIHGATAPTYLATISGTYLIRAYFGNPDLCFDSRSADVIVNVSRQRPAVSLDLECDGELLLEAPDGFTFESYLWNTDEETSTITITKPGTYSFVGKEVSGCTINKNFVVNDVCNKCLDSKDGANFFQKEMHLEEHKLIPIGTRVYDERVYIVHTVFNTASMLVTVSDLDGELINKWLYVKPGEYDESYLTPKDLWVDENGIYIIGIAKSSPRPDGRGLSPSHAKTGYFITESFITHMDLHGQSMWWRYDSENLTQYNAFTPYYEAGDLDGFLITGGIYENVWPSVPKAMLKRVDKNGFTLSLRVLNFDLPCSTCWLDQESTFGFDIQPIKGQLKSHIVLVTTQSDDKQPGESHFNAAAVNEKYTYIFLDDNGQVIRKPDKLFSVNKEKSVNKILAKFNSDDGSTEVMISGENTFFIGDQNYLVNYAFNGLTSWDAIESGAGYILIGGVTSVLLHEVLNNGTILSQETLNFKRPLNGGYRMLFTSTRGSILTSVGTDQYFGICPVYLDDLIYSDDKKIGSKLFAFNQALESTCSENGSDVSLEEFTPAEENTTVFEVLDRTGVQSNYPEEYIGDVFLFETCCITRQIEPSCDILLDFEYKSNCGYVEVTNVDIEVGQIESIVSYHWTASSSGTTLNSSQELPTFSYYFPNDGLLTLVLSYYKDGKLCSTTLEKTFNTKAEFLNQEHHDNGWQKVFTNNSNSMIGSWTIAAGDQYYPGDYDGDDEEELLCVNSTGTAMSLLKYDDVSNPGDWTSLWSASPGDQILGYTAHFIIGDFDNTRDMLLGDGFLPSGAPGWTTLFRFDGTTFQWHWSDQGSATPFGAYKGRLHAGDLNGDGEDEIIGFGWDGTNYLTEIFVFDGGPRTWSSLYLEVGFSNLAQNGYSNYIVIGDFGGSGVDQMLTSGHTKRLFQYFPAVTVPNPCLPFSPATIREVWGPISVANLSAEPFQPAGMYMPQLLVGDLDLNDNKDEILLIEKLGSPDYAVIKELNAQTALPCIANFYWQENWSTSADESFIDDWSIELLGGLNTKYLLIQTRDNLPSELLAIRQSSCDGKFLASMYNTGTSTVNYKKDPDSKDETAGFDELKNSQLSWSIYPNPTANRFTIRNSTSLLSYESVVITNIDGKIISEFRDVDSNKEYDLSGNGSSMYFVEIRTGDIVQRMKVILTN